MAQFNSWRPAVSIFPTPLGRLSLMPDKQLPIPLVSPGEFLAEKKNTVQSVGAVYLPSEGANAPPG